MKAMREAYIWAYLRKHGQIHRNCLREAFLLSPAQATNDLRSFQTKHGKLIYDHGTRTYGVPEDYSPKIDLKPLSRAVRLLWWLIQDADTQSPQGQEAQE